MRSKSRRALSNGSPPVILRQTSKGHCGNGNYGKGYYRKGDYRKGHCAILSSPSSQVLATRFASERLVLPVLGKTYARRAAVTPKELNGRPLTRVEQVWQSRKDGFVDFKVITTPLGDGKALSVAVYGELDLASCERLKPALDEAVFARRPLILDLSGCSFIDSSGLRVVIQVARDLSGNGEDRAVPMAVVAGEGSAVRKMLALTAIDLRTPVFEAPDEATTWLDGRQKPNGQPNSSSNALP